MSLTKAKIGFIGSSAPSSPHHESFKAFIPKEIDFTFVQEEGAGGSLYDARGKVDSLVDQATELVGQHGWMADLQRGGPARCSIPDCGVVFLCASPRLHRLELVRGGFEGILGQTRTVDDPCGRQAKRNVSGLSCRVRNRSCLSPANAARSHRTLKAHPR